MTDHDFTRNPYFIDRSPFSRLGTDLYLSGCDFAGKHDWMRSLGITAVCNLTPDDFGAVEAGFEVLHLKLEDGEEFDEAVVKQFLDWMEARRAAGDVTLLHCHAGISRTSSFAIAWLMHLAGANRDKDLRHMWSRAEDLVGTARPIIMPHYKLKATIIRYFEGVTA